MDVLIASMEMKRSHPRWAHWNGIKSWLLILVFQRAGKHFTSSAAMNSKQRPLWVVTGPFRGVGVREENSAELRVRVLQIPRIRVVFTHLPLAWSLLHGHMEK